MTQLGMDHQHGAAIAIQKRVTKGEQPHHLAGTLPQQALVAADAQSFLHRQLRMRGMAEPGSSLGHGDLRSRGRTVLPSPRIEALEEDAMDGKEIFIAQGASPLRQVHDGFVQTGAEHLVFQFLDDLRILLGELVPQVARRLEILERIKHPACAPAGSSRATSPCRPWSACLHA
ncbi:hypothetical protein D3C86_1622820 [compost metagenome]